MTTRKPILCLDFDGVIHSYTSGWKGLETITDPPVPGAIEFILSALGTFEVAIYSSRSWTPWGIAAMKRWLEREANASAALPSDLTGADVVAAIDWPSDKPAALVTLDDRALTFTGTWPSIEELLAFQPWNKRSDADRQIDAQVEADVAALLAEVDALGDPKKHIRMGIPGPEHDLILLCQRLANALR